MHNRNSGIYKNPNPSEYWSEYEKLVKSHRPGFQMAVNQYALFQSRETGGVIFGRPCTPGEREVLQFPYVNRFEESLHVRADSVPHIVVEGFALPKPGS